MYHWLLTYTFRTVSFVSSISTVLWNYWNFLTPRPLVFSRHFTYWSPLTTLLRPQRKGVFLWLCKFSKIQMKAKNFRSLKDTVEFRLSTSQYSSLRKPLFTDWFMTSQEVRGLEWPRVRRGPRPTTKDREEQRRHPRSPWVAPGQKTVSVDPVTGLLVVEGGRWSGLPSRLGVRQ